MQFVLKLGIALHIHIRVTIVVVVIIIIVSDIASHGEALDVALEVLVIGLGGGGVEAKLLFQLVKCGLKLFVTPALVM